MTVESTTTVGQFHSIQDGVKSMYSLSAAVNSNLKQYQMDIEVTVSGIQEKDSLIFESKDSLQIVTMQSEKDSLLIVLSGQLTLLNNEFSQINTQRTSDAGQLLSTNNGIVSVLLHETNEQEVNSIYLSTYAIDSLPDSLQILTLQAIANQCPLEGGTAVYRARALLQSNNYDDAMLCANANTNDAGKQVGLESSFSLYPNPSNGNITLILPGGEQTIRITNALGQLVHEWENIEITGHWILPNLNLESGSYFCTVMTKGKQESKLFVILQ